MQSTLPFCYLYLGAAAEIVKIAVDGLQKPLPPPLYCFCLRLCKQPTVSSSASVFVFVNNPQFLYITWVGESVIRILLIYRLHSFGLVGLVASGFFPLQCPSIKPIELNNYNTPQAHTLTPKPTDRFTLRFFFNYF